MPLNCHLYLSLKFFCVPILFSLLPLDHFLHVADKVAALVGQQAPAVQARQHEGHHEHEVGEDGPGHQAPDERRDQEGDSGDGGVVDGGGGPGPPVLGAHAEMMR